MAATAATAGRVRRVRVVIADDDDDFRLLMRRRLELDGRFVVVGEAREGAEAARLTEHHRPDAAIMDLAMPGVDGLAAIGLIRDRVPDTKVVVLSGYDANLKAEEALREGAFAYLEKTTAPAQILNVLAPLAPPEFE